MSTSAVVKTTNPFSSQSEFTTGTAAAKENSASDADPILEYTRRPFRGMELATDTPASLSIRTSVGGVANLLRNSSGITDTSWFTTNFMLQAVSVSRNEKFQEIETFGPTYGFFFGERPIMLTAQALLLSTPDFPWVVEWWWNYSHGLSGTRLSEANSRVYLEYDELILEGYILNCQMSETADQPNSCSMTFTMWVTQVDYKITPGSNLRQDLPRELRVDYGAEADITSVQVGPVSTTADVRATNIAKLFLQRTGLAAIRQLAGEVKSFVGDLGGLTDLASVFLLGRNITIPEGYLGSEIYAGSAEFAPGTLTDLQLKAFAGLDALKFRTIKLPPEFSANTLNNRLWNKPFHYNLDEYPYASTLTRQTVITAGVTDYFVITRGYAVSGVTEAGVVLPLNPTLLPIVADSHAQAQFRKTGLGKLYPMITNTTGGSFPEWAIALGRSAYGGVLLAGSVIADAEYGLDPVESSAAPNTEGNNTTTIVQAGYAFPSIYNQDLSDTAIVAAGG